MTCKRIRYEKKQLSRAKKHIKKIIRNTITDTVYLEQELKKTNKKCAYCEYVELLLTISEKNIKKNKFKHFYYECIKKAKVL